MKDFYYKRSRFDTVVFTDGRAQGHGWGLGFYVGYFVKGPFVTSKDFLLSVFTNTTR